MAKAKVFVGDDKKTVYGKFGTKGPIPTQLVRHNRVIKFGRNL